MNDATRPKIDRRTARVLDTCRRLDDADLARVMLMLNGIKAGTLDVEAVTGAMERDDWSALDALLAA